MTVSHSTLEAIKYEKSLGELLVLNQLLLPYESKYEKVVSAKEGHSQIKEMKVRGAPAIAIVAALSLAVELQHSKALQEMSLSDFGAYIHERLEFLKTSRPTAVNLFEACDRIQELVALKSKCDGADAKQVASSIVEFAQEMLIKDVQDNKGFLHILNI